MGVKTEAPPDDDRQSAEPVDAVEADSSAKATAASNTVRGHIAALLPFARDDAASYTAAAVLAVLGTLCQLGPFYVIYLAIRDLLAGTTTLSGMLGLAVAALVLLVAQYVLMALSTLMSHRAAFRTLYRFRPACRPKAWPGATG